MQLWGRPAQLNNVIVVWRCAAWLSERLRSRLLKLCVFVNVDVWTLRNVNISRAIDNGGDVHSVQREQAGLQEQ